MEIYLKCLKSFTMRDPDGHPEWKIEAGHIYKTDPPAGRWSWTERFTEVSKVEVFVYLKGQMDLVEELP
jgi:hypothetical protein